MANRPAPALVLREGDRCELERLTRSFSVWAGLVQRARIVFPGCYDVEAVAEEVRVRPWSTRLLARHLGVSDNAVGADLARA